MKHRNRKRSLVLVFGAFAIFFTGYPHIWSIYQPYAMELTGWSESQASMNFYIYFVTFVLGNIVGGRFQDRKGPRAPVGIGGGIFAASILLSALTLRRAPFLTYLTYGVLQGFGQGMIYTTIISTVQKWFPENKGFASGVIVTANGLCGFFMAPLSRAMLSELGIEKTFLTVAAMIGLSWLFSAAVIDNPPGANDSPRREALEAPKEGTARGQRQYTSSEMMRTKKFYYLLATMLFGLIPYLLVSPFSQTIQMDRGVAASVAVAAVMAGSVVNAATRLALPVLADRIGRTVCVKAVLAAAAAAMALLSLAPGATTLCIVLVYGCYGGIMGSFPSLCSTIFGMEHSGENYGFVMFGMALATLGAPVITKTMLGRGLALDTVFLAGAGCAAAAYVFLMLLERELGSGAKDTVRITEKEGKDYGAC